MRTEITDNAFAFDLTAKITQKSDHQILVALERFAEAVGYRYFQTREFDKWKDRSCHSCTVIERFGSWKKALAIIGIEGGHKREYSREELVTNLEGIWKELGRPPGHRQMGEMGARISCQPYNRTWGSVRKACEAIAAFHQGRITREQLLAGNEDAPKRETVPLNLRWAVLKRDNYRCVVCGASPATDHSVQLEVDHITSVAKRGGNDSENLRTLCKKCNGGKGDE